MVTGSRAYDNSYRAKNRWKSTNLRKNCATVAAMPHLFAALQQPIRLLIKELGARRSATKSPTPFKLPVSLVRTRPTQAWRSNGIFRETAKCQIPSSPEQNRSSTLGTVEADFTSLP